MQRQYSAILLAICVIGCSFGNELGRSLRSGQSALLRSQRSIKAKHQARQTSGDVRECHLTNLEGCTLEEGSAHSSYNPGTLIMGNMGLLMQETMASGARCQLSMSLAGELQLHEVRELLPCLLAVAMDA